MIHVFNLFKIIFCRYSNISRSVMEVCLQLAATMDMLEYGLPTDDWRVR